MDYYPNTQKESEGKGILVFGLVVIVMTSLGLFFYLYISNSNLSSHIPLEEEHRGALEDQIYFTAASGTSTAASIYALDLASGEIKIPSEEFADNDYVRYTSSISPDGREIAYLLSPREDTSSFFPYTQPLQLLSFPFEDPEEWELWTETNNTYATRLPTWSPDGEHILYTGMHSTTSPGFREFMSISNWSIYHIERGGGEGIQIVHGATNPEWSPNGDSLLYLKHDGIYAVAISEPETEHLVLGGAAYSTADQMDISSDGERLAVSHEGTVHVYEVTWDTTPQLSLLTSFTAVDGNLYWPTFSKTGSHIAVVAHNLPEGELGNAIPDDILHSVRIFEVESKEMVNEFNLSPFNPTFFTMITDWR